MAARSAMLGLALSALALVIVAATDQGGAARARLGMLAALAPALGSVAAHAAASLARARGETRALGALGISPLGVSRGACAAGTALGLVGALLLASGIADPSAVFVRPPEGRVFETTRPEAGPPRMVERDLGVSVDARGTLSPPSGAGEGPTLFAALALALAAIAGPLFALAPAGRAERAAVLALAALALVASFQAVAAGLWPPFALLAGPTLLAAHVATALARARRR